MSTQTASATEIRPFEIDVSDDELADLRSRVEATKWPDRETDASHQLETIQALARYWATDYDWRKFEERFAALPHFITEIDGVDIHLVGEEARDDLDPDTLEPVRVQQGAGGIGAGRS